MIISTTYVDAGLLILSNPPAGAVELTLLASGLLMVGVAMASGGIILWLAWPSVDLLILGSLSCR